MSHSPGTHQFDAAWEQWLAERFAWNVLTVRQKLLTLAQRYVVCDQNEFPLFHVVRPPRLAMNLVAVVASAIVRLVFVLVAFALVFRGEALLGLAMLFVGGFVAWVVYILMVPFRDIRVFADEAEQCPLLTITQDNKLGLYQTYTIYDAVGQPVAIAKRLVPLAWFRRNWEAVTLDGRRIVRVLEDSLILSLLRRYLGPLWGLLRTNFDILLPNGVRIGEYNRKLTLTDQYVLNLSADPQLLVDRRVALALAILLDTAEGR
ncbi:hypothetical protein GC173_01055 [bacterium]|nr:hypothetical protein [bacterium]